MFRSALVFVPLLVGLVVLAGFAVWAQRPDPPPQPNQGFRPIATPQTGQTQKKKLIREKTAFKEMLVFFRQTGDRTALYTVADSQRFVCLENLELERILTTMQEKPERQFWKIDGEYTEFRGENYVFIRRSVSAPPPAAAIPAAP